MDRTPVSYVPFNVMAELRMKVDGSDYLAYAYSALQGEHMDDTVRKVQKMHRQVVGK